MISPKLVQGFLAHIKFMDVFAAFTLATLPFACRCKRRSLFWLRAGGFLVFMRVLCLSPTPMTAALPWRCPIPSLSSPL